MAKLNLFGRILEVKLKKKEDKARLKLLVDLLFEELRLQGHDTKGSSLPGFVTIYKFDTHFDINSGHEENAIEIAFKEG